MEYGVQDVPRKMLKALEIAGHVSHSSVDVHPSSACMAVSFFLQSINPGCCTSIPPEDQSGCHEGVRMQTCSLRQCTPQDNCILIWDCLLKADL